MGGCFKKISFPATNRHPPFPPNRFCPYFHPLLACSCIIHTHGYIDLLDQYIAQYRINTSIYRSIALYIFISQPSRLVFQYEDAYNPRNLQSWSLPKVTKAVSCFEDPPKTTILGSHKLLNPGCSQLGLSEHVPWSLLAFRVSCGLAKLGQCSLAFQSILKILADLQNGLKF